MPDIDDLDSIKRLPTKRFSLLFFPDHKKVAQFSSKWRIQAEVAKVITFGAKK